MLCSCFSAKMFEIPAVCCVLSAMILKFALCSLSSAKCLSKTQTEDFTLKGERRTLCHGQCAKPWGVQLALGFLHSQAMPSPTAAELAQAFGGKPTVSQDQLLLCFRRPRWQWCGDSGPWLSFYGLTSKNPRQLSNKWSRHCLWTQEFQCTAVLKLYASWLCVWGTAQRPVLALWWCWLNRSHCSLKQSKTGTAQQFVEVFSWDHHFKDREAKKEASGKTLEVNFESGAASHPHFSELPPFNNVWCKHYWEPSKA